jgi:hypothetical protein
VREVRGNTLGFIGTAAACAVCVGMLMITATVLGVDALRSDQGPRNLDLAFYLLVGGTLGGILLAATAAWHLLAPVGSTYRKGALSIVSAFATVLFMLVCMPVNQLFGRTGLLALLAICGVAALILARRTRRLGIDA